MKISIVARVFTGVGLYAFAMAIFLQAYFYLWKVVPSLATLAGGMDLRFPGFVVFVLTSWQFLGWPLVVALPVLLGVGALPERAFLRVSVILGPTLVCAQVAMSCFFIFMQVLGQTWWVLALEKVGSNG